MGASLVFVKALEHQWSSKIDVPLVWKMTQNGEPETDPTLGTHGSHWILRLCVHRWHVGNHRPLSSLWIHRCIMMHSWGVWDVYTFWQMSTFKCSSVCISNLMIETIFSSRTHPKARSLHRTTLEICSPVSLGLFYIDLSSLPPFQEDRSKCQCLEAKFHKYPSPSGCCSVCREKNPCFLPEISILDELHMTNPFLQRSVGCFSMC